jgi:CheY-like chemotaxis protein
MNILLVEDNDLNRDMLSRRLVRRGFRVECAVDGEAGVRMARDTHPDVILMDIGLPVIDGWEAIRQLKSVPETSEIPIIALTAHTSNEDRARAQRAGCAGFVSKPIDLQYLLDTIAGVHPAGHPPR